MKITKIQTKAGQFRAPVSTEQELSKHGVKAGDIPNLTNLGKAIRKLRWKRLKHKNDRGYYLCLRKPSK
jgi:hypothetical protein